MKRALWLVAAGAAFAASLQPAAAQRAPVKVVASFSVLGDMVQNVGGDKIALTTLVGANGDTHVYQPTPADAKAVAEARLFIVNGLGLEGWLPRLVGAVGFKGKVATVSDGIKPLTMEDEDAPKASGKTRRVADPHAWQSLANGRTYVANIVAALSEADPEGAAFYRERGEAYSRRLAALDEKVKAELAAVPKAKRRVITSHDAFQYYGKAYGVEFVAPLGISTESEASAGDIAKLIRQNPQGEGEGALHRECQRPAADRAARQGSRRGRRPAALFRCALEARRAGGDLSCHVRAQYRRAEGRDAAQLTDGGRRSMRVLSRFTDGSLENRGPLR